MVEGGLYLGVDTGGTYTDAAIFDPVSRRILAKAKSPTTRPDLGVGIARAIDGAFAAAAGRGENIAPRRVVLASLSTTLATNALVEGQGAPAGLILIGFGADALDRAGLGTALGGDPVVFVEGGHDALGGVRAPLDEAAVKAAVQAMQSRVAGVAIAAEFAVRNPAHERRAREIAREAGLPATLSSELAQDLDAPRRALTALLNARLVGMITRLVDGAEGMLRARGISAPLMVVKGDGSLVSAAFARERPVETILSGPAASVVGAHYLCGRSAALVVDIGGTTTDIALVENGRPRLDPRGARVGGFRTMVEAIAARTIGLGGDSEVTLDSMERLTLGPRRVVPAALVAHETPAVLETLRRQLARDRPDRLDGRFGRRIGVMPRDGAGRIEAEIFAALDEAPRPLADIARTPSQERALMRLVQRGVAQVSGVTPSDAAHVLNRQTNWSREAALLALRLVARSAGLPGMSPERLSQAIMDAFVARATEAVAVAALSEAGVEVDGDARSAPLLARALSPEAQAGVRVGITLDYPLAAIGGPAGLHMHEVARRLGTEALTPADGDVANAVGAVVAGVLQAVTVVVTGPQPGLFRVMGEAGPSNHSSHAAALAAAEAEARELATARAINAGAADPACAVSIDETVIDVDGMSMFVEARVTATAGGAPRLL